MQVSPAPYLAQQHQRIAWIGGSVVDVVLDAASTGGALAVLRSTLSRGDSAPVHVHTREDEAFLVLQRQATFWVGELRQTLSDGGVVFLPRDLPHTYRADVDDTHLLNICTPGGFEGFFRAAGHDLATPPPNGWTLTTQAMGAALVAHGGQIVGPPKSLGE